MTTSDAARALGRQGVLARARRLSPADRRRIAAAGGRARARSQRAERRLAENFLYLRALDQLRPRPAVKRLNAFRGPLPGLYPAKP